MRTRGRILAAAVLAAALAVTGAPAGAQQPATATASASCVDGVGVITVMIDAGSLETSEFDVFIHDVMVATDVLEGTYDYQPYANGMHRVRVDWLIDDGIVILDEDVTVNCEPPATSTTAAPTTTSTVAAATVAQPRFTG